MDEQPYTVKYHELAFEDLKALDKSVAKRVLQKIKEVAVNPVSIYEGGRGYPLGNKRGVNLHNLYKIKMRGLGIRVVYQLHITETAMYIIVVGVRDKDEVYETAYKRIRDDE